MCPGNPIEDEDMLEPMQGTGQQMVLLQDSSEPLVHKCGSRRGRQEAPSEHRTRDFRGNSEPFSEVQTAEDLRPERPGFKSAYYLLQGRPCIMADPLPVGPYCPITCLGNHERKSPLPLSFRLCCSQV
jgi:hypothetical protein